MSKLRGDKWADLARRLNEGGCPVLLEHGYQVLPQWLRLAQIPTIGVNTVFDLDTGGTGCTVDVSIESRLDYFVRVDGSRFDFLPGNMQFQLLAGPEGTGERAGNYCFPGSCLAFDKEIVLNNLFSGKAKIGPGGRSEGLLLLVSEAPMPEAWRHRKAVRMTVSLYRGRSALFRSQFTICVDPGARWEESANPAMIAALIESVVVPKREWEFEQVRSTIHDLYRPIGSLEALLADKLAARLYGHVLVWKKEFKPLNSIQYSNIIMGLTSSSPFHRLILRAIKEFEHVQSLRKAAEKDFGESAEASDAHGAKTLQNQASGRACK